MSVNIQDTYKDPFFHFFLLGIALFVLHALVTKNNQNTTLSMPNTVMQEFFSDYQLRKGTPPNKEVIEKFKNQWIEQEILYTEGATLGLINNDPIIRSRVIEKMRLLFSQDAIGLIPSDSQLKEFLDQNKDNYTQSTLYSYKILLPFEINESNKNQPSINTIEKLKDTLNTGADPDSLALPYRIYNQVNTATIVATQGKAFLEQLSQLKSATTWHTLQSKHGLAIVKITDYKPETVMPFEKVRNRLLVDWRKRQRVNAINQKVSELKKNYSIVY